MGAVEAQLFDEANAKLKVAKRAAWERVPKDLSGPDKLVVALWLMRGDGREVITELALVLAPDLGERTDPLKNEARIATMKRSGVVVAGHAALNFEIRGSSARRAGRNGPVIDDIVVSMSGEMDEFLTEKYYDRILPALDRFGLGKRAQPVNLWVHIKRFPVKSAANQLAKDVLSSFEWWTVGIGGIVDKFAITVEPIVEIYDSVFTPLLLPGVYGSGGDGVALEKIQVAEWLDQLREPRSDYFIYLLETCGCTETDAVNFTQYMGVVATFCMFGKVELARFLYGFCLRDQQVATLERFDAMCTSLLRFEDSKFSSLKRKKMFAQFANAKGDLFWEGFEKLIEGVPVLLWPVQRLQMKIATQNLGEGFWRSQKEAMVAARARLGIRRDLK